MRFGLTRQIHNLFGDEDNLRPLSSLKKFNNIGKIQIRDNRLTRQSQRENKLTPRNERHLNSNYYLGHQPIYYFGPSTIITEPTLN